MGASRFGFYPAGIVKKNDASISPITHSEGGRAEGVVQGSIEGEAIAAPSGQEEKIEDEVGQEELGERAPRIARRPDKPTKAMIEEHEPLHVHYRSWCPHCQAGRSVSKRHMKRAEGGPVISKAFGGRIGEGGFLGMTADGQNLWQKTQEGITNRSIHGGVLEGDLGSTVRRGI